MARNLSLAIAGALAIVYVCNGRIAHKAVRGWNSWDAVGLEGNLSLTHQAAAFLTSSGLQKHGYSYITTDAGWYGDIMDGNQIDPMQVAMDGYGRLLPSEARWPGLNGTFRPLADDLASKGFSFGHWLLRGIPVRAVAEATPIKGMEQYTARDIARFDRNCTWSKLGVGVNTSHPAAQAWYDSVVELAVENHVSLLKWDCLFASNLVADELELISNAVRNADADIVLSLSPGGEATPELGKWVNSNDLATYFRIDGDFWDTTNPAQGWDQLWVHVETALAFAVAGVPNGNLDMLPLGKVGCGTVLPPCRWANFNQAEAQMIVGLWSMTKSPLIWGGLPDPAAYNDTVHSLLANTDILALQASSDAVIGFNSTVQPASVVTASFAQVGASGSSANVLLINGGDATATKMTATWSDMGMHAVAPSACCTVVDLWTQDSSVHCGGVTASVSPHASFIAAVGACK
jgi:hypothetical protein